MIPEDPLIGRQFGSYRVEHLIGRGGMAVVYYGWDVQLERPVAIKVIDARYRSNRAYAERFVREARAVATWRHENVVQVYYAGEEDGLYYFAMEYVDGLDLDSLLAEYVVAGELMPYADVLRIGRAVASALDYAHARGIVHRDVKPANVLVANDGRVVLSDFGLAMDVEQGSLGEVFGSANYISPEQARRSADAVPQSDQYSLGVMLFEMFTGRVPFTDPSPTSVALQHIMSPPPRPGELNPSLGAETEAVLLRVLSKSPAERYATCGEMVEALAETLDLTPSPRPAAGLLPLSSEVGEEKGDREKGVRPVQPSLSHLSVAERVALYRQAHAPAGAPPPAEPAPPPTDSLIGVQLDEYRLEALLGQGGMARIYRAVDVRLKRFAAIKVIAAPRRNDSDYVRRFEREAQAIAQLEHPNIVRLYRYGQAHDVLYMAMQFIEGQDLHHLLASYRDQGQLLPPSRVVQIVREACQALDYAHSKGVIHRDIKPSNIMLDSAGHAILTDFGLVLLTEAGTQGEAFGSPRYIAPEQAISSAGAVPQSDLYAIGVILYEMFTGELPFDADDPLALALKHMAEAPRPPRERRPGLSPAVEAVILKALAKDPAERYPTGAALVAALDEALAGGPLSTAPGEAAVPSATGPAEAATLVPASVGAVSAARPLPPPPAAVAAPGTRQTDTLPPSRRPAQPARINILPVLWTLAALVLVALLASGGLLLIQSLSSPHPPPGGPSPTATATRSTPAVVTPSPTHAAGPTTAATPAATVATPQITMPVIPPTQEPPTPTLLSATPTTTPSGYDLLLVRRGDESLFVINTGSVDLPLAWLHLAEGEGQIAGRDWGIEQLKTGHCVAVWNDKGHPRPPDGVDCTPDEDSERLVRDGKQVFWKNAFPVLYADQEVTQCFPGREDRCVVHIAGVVP
jgi:serine/threonine protein kinase